MKHLFTKKGNEPSAALLKKSAKLLLSYASAAFNSVCSSSGILNCTCLVRSLNKPHLPLGNMISLYLGIMISYFAKKVNRTGKMSKKPLHTTSKAV